MTREELIDVIRKARNELNRGNGTLLSVIAALVHLDDALERASPKRKPRA